MYLVDRYIIKNVILSTCVVMAVLLGVACFMQFFGEVGDIGKANFTAVKASLYVLMQLPFSLYQLFPMAGFIGCLIGLGRLSSTSELIVIRASGYSIIDILFSVIKAALLMLVVVTLLGEVVAPMLQSKSEHMKAVALGKQKSYANLGGVWLRDKDKFIHFGDVTSTQTAKDVSVFTLSNHQLRQASYAPVAKRLGTKLWQMQKVRQTQLKQDHSVTRQLPVMNLAINFDPVVLSLGQQSVNQQSVLGLYQSIKYRAHAGLENDGDKVALWQRIFQPFATIIMISLGIPFVFGSLRNATMGFRLLTGVIVGFAFYTLNQFLGPLALVYQISPIIGSAIPTVVFLMVCIVLFRRVS